MSPRRRRRSRLLGLLLLLALVEGALQLAAPLIQVLSRRAPEVPRADVPATLLCVGDSNTYGLHLPQVYAYPAQLAALLGRHFDRTPVVVNRGVPGQASGQVAAHLAADLAAVQPDLVLILAGINDTWNAARTDDGPAAWISRLRLVRLARVLAAGVTSSSTFEVSTDPQGQVVVDRGAGAERVHAGEAAASDPGDGVLERAVTAGLRDAIERCRDHGAVPVLLTYAEHEGPYARVNAVIRALAGERGVLLVDLGQAFADAFTRESREALMFSDHHPNARGYQLVAETVAAELTRAGLVPPLRVPDARTLPIRALPAGVPTAAMEADGSLRLRGPEGWPWQLLLGCRAEPGEGFQAGSHWVPLRATDPVLALSRLQPGLSGRFDASGEVRVPVPAALRQRAACPLSACLVLLHEITADGPGDARQEALAAISERLEIP